MNGPRIGSLFSGYGGLDMAVQDVIGGTVAWHCQYEPPDKKGREDKHQAAAKILAHHWPDVPNHGDVTRIDWAAVEPVDVLAGGFPCTDLSLAGHGAGLFPGTRSGLWAEMARAIHALRPRLVVIENVPGILSRKADRGLGPGAADLDPTTGARRTLRALGAVLGDLAGLGFDAEWVRIRASDVGAAHERARVFVVAWPAASDPSDFGRERTGRARNGRPGPANGGDAAAHAEHPGRAWLSGPGATTGTGPVGEPSGRGADAAAHAGGQGLEVRAVEPARPQLPTAERGRRQPAADADGRRLPRHPELPQGRDAVQQRVRGDADRRPAVDWGAYEPAIRRAEEAFGRPAPRPTDDHGRLSAHFDEWHMGLPAGHVTGVPGIPRPQQIKAIGNGVVPQQAAYALRMLLDRAGALR
ncbi:DNA cytosine methyltransferase [Yinghuangia aomiensis]